MPPTTGRAFQAETKKLINNAVLLCHRERFTIAQINAGATLLPALPNQKYRLQDAAMIAVGGTVGGATDVRILGTRAGAAVALMTAAVAGLVQSVRLGNSTAATQGADGQACDTLDSNTAITVGKTGGTATTATHVDVLVSYTIERG